LLDIIGGGAIGLSIAARLALNGTSVRIWTRTKGQAERLTREGIAYEHGEPLRAVAVRAEARHWEEAADANGLEPAPRWVLLTVKQTDATGAEVVSCLRQLAGRSGAEVLCLQNGIGHMERLRAACPDIRFIEGVTTEGALRLDERTVRQTGQGELWLAASEAPDRQKMLLNRMQKAGIKCYVSKNIKDQVYAKLLVNAVINPLTALFGVRNGELPESRSRLALMRGLFEESLRILSADPGYVPRGGEWERIVEICRLTAANTSSMLADIQAGRPTEVDAINGGIVRIAGRLGMRAPMNEAAVAWITALEAQGTERGE